MNGVKKCVNDPRKSHVLLLIAREKQSKVKQKNVRRPSVYTFHQGTWEDLMISQTEKDQHL